MSTPAPIGHNSGEPDQAAFMQKRAERLIDAAQRVAIPTNTDDLEKLIGFARQAQLCAQDIEKLRKDEKQPHMDAARAVDGKWKKLTAPLETAVAAVKDKATAYMRLRGEQSVTTEHGARLTIRTDIAGEIIDGRDLDVDALLPFIEVGALEKAIRAYVKAKSPKVGSDELSGVRFLEKEIVVLS